MADKVTFEDVSEKFIGIAGRSDATLVKVWHCSEEIGSKCRFLAVWLTSAGLFSGHYAHSDLVPTPPPASPWDGFPWGEWWRHSIHHNGREQFIHSVSVEAGNVYMTFGGDTPLETLRTRYEHSPNPITGPWSKGWGDDTMKDGK